MWSFDGKKRFYLLLVAVLNIACILVLFFLAEVKLAFALVLLMKIKDILLVAWQVINWFRPKERLQPISLDAFTIVSIIPAYNETNEEIHNTISSICSDVNPCNHLVCVIIDGKKTEFQLDVKLEEQIVRYRSWKSPKEQVLQLCYGKINETPSLLIVKPKNLGKRDSLILAHEIFNFPRKDGKNQDLRHKIRERVSGLFNLREFNFIFCTDADTFLEKHCLSYLVQTLEKTQAIACCGLVMIDSKGKPWSFWNILQNFQYIYGQFIRRAAESLKCCCFPWLLGGEKVTCLPGPITLFRVHPLASSAIKLYGQYPSRNDLFKSIIQLLGTDRRLTNAFLFQDMSVKLVQDVRAIAKTVPPTTWKAYHNQRRRWSSNEYFNTLYLIGGKNIPLRTRFLAIIDFMKKTLIFFRFFNIFFFIWLLAYKHDQIPWIIFTASLVIFIIPVLFFFIKVVWSPVFRPLFLQLVLGLLYDKLCGSFLSLAVSSLMFSKMGSTVWSANDANSKFKIRPKRIISTPDSSPAISPDRSPERSPIMSREKRPFTITIFDENRLTSQENLNNPKEQIAILTENAEQSPPLDPERSPDRKKFTITHFDENPQNSHENMIPNPKEMVAILTHHNTEQFPSSPERKEPNRDHIEQLRLPLGQNINLGRKQLMTRTSCEENRLNLEKDANQFEEESLSQHSALSIASELEQDKYVINHPIIKTEKDFHCLNSLTKINDDGSSKKNATLIRFEYGERDHPCLPNSNSPC